MFFLEIALLNFGIIRAPFSLKERNFNVLHKQLFVQDFSCIKKKYIPN